MAKSFFIKDEVKDYFKAHMKYYVFILSMSFVGLIVGVILCLTGYDGVGLLDGSQKILIDYINGSAGYFSIFFTRIKNILLELAIIFVLTINIHTAFLAFIFIAYQVSIFVIGCCGVLSIYGFAGFFNIIFLMLPINLFNYILVVSSCCVLAKRAYDSNKYKVNFIKSFNENYVLRNYLICVILMILMTIFSSVVYPILFKSFVVLTI